MDTGASTKANSFALVVSLSSGEAEQHLNQAMADVEAVTLVASIGASQPPRRMLLTSTVASSK